jgi:hypothetical protein
MDKKQIDKIKKWVKKDLAVYHLVKAEGDFIVDRVITLTINKIESILKTSAKRRPSKKGT